MITQYNILHFVAYPLPKGTSYASLVDMLDSFRLWFDRNIDNAYELIKIGVCLSVEFRFFDS